MKPINLDAENWRIVRSQGQWARWLLQTRTKFIKVDEYSSIRGECEVIDHWETVRVYLEYMDAMNELKHILSTGKMTEL